MTRHSIIILLILICYYAYLRVACRFCKQYLMVTLGREKLFMVLLFAGDVLSRILHRRYEAAPDILFALGKHVALIGAVLLLFWGDTGKKMLTAAILTTVTTLMGNFCMSLSACLTLLWKHNWNQIPVPFIEQGEEEMIILAVLLAETLAVYWLSGRQLSFFCIGKGRLSAPLLAITLVVDVANWGASHGVMVRSGGNMGLYYDQIFSYMEFLVLTVLSMSAAGFYLFGLERIYLEQRKSAQYHARIAAYQMLEEQYGQMERLRHDMKNHVVALTGLLENREWEKMTEYLDRMRDSGGLGKAEEATGSRAVDALLYQKRQVVENEKIRWECDVQIPKACRIHEFDLCVLFGNILDNAVEACRRLEGGRTVDETESERFIEIRAGAVKRCFLLEVRNSVDPEEKRRDERINQKDQGRRNDQDRHGIGLLNIKDMIARYNGAMSTEVQDGVFSISVLVPLEEDEART